MSPISSTALSGLNAASLQLQSSAHNIANTQTPGFRRQLVQQSAEPSGGVRASIETSAVPGEALAEDIVNDRIPDDFARYFNFVLIRRSFIHFQKPQNLTILCIDTFCRKRYITPFVCYHS